MRFDDDELRTQTLGHLNGLSRMDTKATGLVAGRRHYTPLRIVANGDGQAFQFRVVEQFHSSEELIHVDMNNLLHCCKFTNF